MKQLRHWQDPVNGLIGVWLVLSSWIVGYSNETTAMANAIVIGVVLILSSLGAMMAPKAWEEWLNALLGLWMIISPWALKFSPQHPATYVAVITGIVALVLALWTLGTDKQLGDAGGKQAAH